MRVLAINQFYAPDEAATSQLLTDLCEDLARGGDEVTVIASQGNYLGGSRLPRSEVRNGVRVLRPFSTSFGKGSIPKRLADYGTFFASAVARAITVRRPDVVLALTTPPLIATGALASASLRGIPLVAWVQDVYPQIAVELGVLDRHHPITTLLDRAARITYARSRRIVALSSGMARRLEELGAPGDRLRVIANWADGRALVPRTSETSFRREHGLEGRFVVMYSGNLGAAHDVATFVEAARKLENHRDVAFVFIGEGVRKPEAERLAQGLGNVRFLPYQPRERLGESLGSADVHLVGLREGFEGLLVPSKVYGALACGKPVLFVGPSGCEVARLVREEGVGFATKPGDAEGVAEAIHRLATDGELARRQGEKARRLFEEQYDRPVAISHWRQVLADAANP